MTEERDMQRYDDIIHLPHHQSGTRPHMSLHDRAAQFSPFAALTGYDAAVEEAARLTEQKLELSEEEKAAIGAKLTGIKEHIKERPEVTVTYFVPDERKAGGTYVTVTGIVRRIDDFERVVIMQDRSRIRIDDIAAISAADAKMVCS